MTTAPEDGRGFAQALCRAIEEAEADLARMPFFVRPMVRGGFSRHTGYSFAGWRDRLSAVRSDDTPRSVAARWPDVEAALIRLLDNVQSAPERARRGMGDNPEQLQRVVAQSARRAALTQALLDWLRR